MRSSVALGGSVLLVGLTLGAGCGDDDGAPGGAGGGATTTVATGPGAGGGGADPGGVQIPGLSAPVQAAYDESGILHLTCATNEDCYAALGYFHAANRFFFMDFVRNLVRGRLGALVKAGATVLERDLENRRFFSTPEGDPLPEKYVADASPELRGYLDAYTLGVNAWIGDMRAGENGATLTTEYDFALIVKEAIRDWEPEDSAAVGLYVLGDLSNNGGIELALAEAIAAYDPALVPDLFSPRQTFDAYTIPSSQVALTGGPAADASRFAALGPLLADAEARLARVGSGGSRALPGDTGSNNWVVAPSRTTSGDALLANDPHLSLTNPSIWFAVEIDAVSAGTGTHHVGGSTFPGIPAVLLGHNEDIAWGMTVAYYDLTDVYVEQVSPDGLTVLFNGQDVPIIERDVTFEDADSGVPVTETIRWVPHHGPIVSEDPVAGTAITMRWRGHEGGTDLDVFTAMAVATSVAEARVALEGTSTLGQNVVVVDTAGDIGWFPYSRVPSRPWAAPGLEPWLPLPGDGSAEWGADLPFAALPQLLNPPGGFIATANQDMTGASADGDILNDGVDAIQTFGKAEGTRERRIVDMLEAGGNTHTVDTMHAIQGDGFSLYGEFTVPVVLAVAATAILTPDEQAVVDALAAWQFTCPTGLDGTDPATAPDTADPAVAIEAIGCTAFHATYFALVHAALQDEVTAAGVSSLGFGSNLVARALRDPTSIASGDLMWDDVSTSPQVETRDEVILRAITIAAEHLIELGTPNDWRWGRVHTLTLRSIYDSFGVATYNQGTYAASGGLHCVNVANPLSRAVPASGDPWNFAFAHGASIRMVVEAREDRPYMRYQLAGGQDLHRESPFYNNLLDGWLANEAIEFPFGPGAVPSPALEIVVQPAP